MSTICLRGGHSPNCKGASGYLDEYDTMQKLYVSVATILTRYGHLVVNCNSNGATANAELTQGANKSNGNQANLFISLHMNASNGEGNGVEAWTYGASSRANPTALRLTENFSKLGFQNRGVKYSTTYFEMKYVNAPNIIFETAFCDNKHDVDLVNTLGVERLAYAVCNAIDQKIPLNPPKEATATTEDTYYRVVVGSYKDKETATKVMNDAKAKGFGDTFLVAFNK